MALETQIPPLKIRLAPEPCSRLSALAPAPAPALAVAAAAVTPLFDFILHLPQTFIVWQNKCLPPDDFPISFP